MKLLKCYVRLHSTTKMFYPGEEVAGDIIIINNKRRYVRGLQLKMKGECTVGYSERQWTKGIDGQYRSKTVDYSATETYISELLNIFGNDGANAEMFPGRYEYPFCFTLPHGVPSSFKGKHGQIIYEIIAILPRSWAFDCKASTAFHVLGRLNLSSIPLANQQSVQKKRQKLSSFCCFNRELSFVMILQRCGVTIGNLVPILLEIKNQTNYLAKGKFTILQETTFYTKDNQRSDQNIICEVAGPVVEPGKNMIWQNDILQVPLLPPTQLGCGCNLIDVSYELQFDLTCPETTIGLNTWSPLIVGTLPEGYSTEVKDSKDICHSSQSSTEVSSQD